MTAPVGSRRVSGPENSNTRTPSHHRDPVRTMDRTKAARIGCLLVVVALVLSGCVLPFSTSLGDEVLAGAVVGHWIETDSAHEFWFSSSGNATLFLSRDECEEYEYDIRSTNATARMVSLFMRDTWSNSTLIATLSFEPSLEVATYPTVADGRQIEFSLERVDDETRPPPGKCPTIYRAVPVDDGR